MAAAHEGDRSDGDDRTLIGYGARRRTTNIDKRWMHLANESSFLALLYIKDSASLALRKQIPPNPSGDESTIPSAYFLAYNK